MIKNEFCSDLALIWLWWLKKNQFLCILNTCPVNGQSIILKWVVYDVTPTEIPPLLISSPPSWFTVVSRHGGRDRRKVKSHGFSVFSIHNKLSNRRSFLSKYICVRTFIGPKSNFMPKGIPIDFEMAEKKVHRQTNK